MAFQGLVSGSECAVAANPLSQVLKHTEGDRSLQQDRIAGPSSSRLHHLPGSSSSVVNEHDAAMARQFFDGPSQAPVMGPPPPFAHAELARMSQMNVHRPPEASEAWIMEQQKSQPMEANFADWTSEFGQTSSHMPGPAASTMASRPEFQQRPSYMNSTSMYGAGPMRMYGPSAGANMFASPQVLDQGKGKAREADFEAAFAQAAASLSATETARIVEVDDVEESLKNASLDDKEELGTDFKKVWDHLQNSDLPPPKEDVAKWEAEFNQLMTTQREDGDIDYTTTFKGWQDGDIDYGNGVRVPGPGFTEDGHPILGDYVFEPNNKFLDPTSSTRSCLTDAKHLLENNGSLSEAALLLEAAIQKGELGEGGYEAWILLGDTRVMDEREDAGMRALSEGVRRAEAAGGGGAGMLSLAISYTNESYDRGSHSMLLRWVQAKYPDHPIPEETIKAMKTNSTWDTHGRVMDVYLSLARVQHASGQMDPDVQTGLGVLLYTNGEYDRAKDCFESALSARPQDYLLWNRLGSCLSNGNKPEEALGVYREALQLRPTYTRAIYNVGVACLNLGAYKESAEHFLTAINLQEGNGGQTSDQLWFTLRRAFQQMERNDLADLAKPETKNLDVFRGQGLDF
ncbi:hypothetical protein HGRIS_002495 [Hohenbuehelia grisea]|uniref:TPR-like protein n=1 Tax=Hohenbuehelia grisea TaxID=104357 RepID=A0ABR3JKM3_9AGAR